MTQSRKIFIRGILWGIVAVLIWSGSLVLLRLGVTTHLNAWDLTALRFGTAAVFLMPVILRRGVAYLRLGGTGLVLMIGGFGAPYIVLMSLALKTAPASAAGALNPGVMAIISVLVGGIMFNDRIGPGRIAGIALIFAGMLFAAVQYPGGFTTGHLILILTGGMWAAYSMTVRKARIPALHATAIVAVGSALIYLPVYILALPKQVFTAPVSDILLQASFQGVLVSIAALYAFNRSAELAGALVGATLPALIPVATLTLGLIVLNEQAGANEVVTSAIIGLGVALILAGRGLASGQTDTPSLSLNLLPSHRAEDRQ